MKKIDPNTIKSICINGFGLIGDLLMRLPFLETVASTFPQAKITLLIDQHRQTLVDNHPNIDQLIIFNRNKKPRLAYIRNFLSLIKTLRKKRYDIFFNLYGGGSSNFITLCSKATFRIGFYRKSIHKFAYTHPYIWPPFAGHWTQEFGILLDSFGIEKQQIRKGTTFEPRSDAYTFIEAETRHIHKPLVLFNLGSGDIKKTWAINHYLQLANYITERYDCHIGVFVNPGQEYLSEQLYALCQHNNIKQISLFKYKDFSHIAALMLKARYLITGDTGLMFIAFGVKLPIIGLFTHTHPDSVIAEDSPSIICYTESDTEKDENNKPYCTNNISVTEVKKAIDYIESDYKELGCFKRTFVRLNQD